MQGNRRMIRVIIVSIIPTHCKYPRRHTEDGRRKTVDDEEDVAANR